MKKLLIIIFLGALLTACSPAGETPTVTDRIETSSPTLSVDSAPVPTTVLPTLTATQLPGRPPGTGLTTDITGAPMNGCTLQTLIRPPDATEESLFPAVSSTDWRSGSDEASTTIVEYGDFQ